MKMSDYNLSEDKLSSNSDTPAVEGLVKDEVFDEVDDDVKDEDAAKVEEGIPEGYKRVRGC